MDDDRFDWPDSSRGYRIHPNLSSGLRRNWRDIPSAYGMNPFNLKAESLMNTTLYQHDKQKPMHNKSTWPALTDLQVVVNMQVGMNS